MNIMKTVKKYLGPELEKIGFSIRNCNKNTIEYINEKGMILIDKGTWKKGSIHIEIFRSKESVTEETRLFLSYIANGFDDLHTYNSGDWYFDTEEELLGLLEHIYEILEKYGFAWMNHEEPFDVHKKIEHQVEKETKALELKHNNPDSQEDEVQKYVDQKFDEWEAQRFLPKKWKVE